MSGRVIHVLDEHVANKIAAGEVIERPASVVKELVENALDAGARSIEIEIRQGGKEYIRVSDDGSGVPADQVPLAFARHATSKIRSADDLFNVSTLGFRGEALPSIAAVAEVEMWTRTADSPGGVRYVVRAGQPGVLEPAGAPVGTTVVVRRLFFNTPARYKFLRSETAERRRVADVTARIALAWPSVAFKLIADGRRLFATAGDGDLAAAIRAVYGAAADDLLPVSGELDGVRVTGWVSKPDVVHGNRERMSVFLNGRWIQGAALLRAIERGYDTMLPPRRYPLAVVHLHVDPSAVDVNVHPAKAEVRFKDDGAVFRAVVRAVREALLGSNLVGSVSQARPVAGKSADGGAHPYFSRPSSGDLLAAATPRAAEAAPSWPRRNRLEPEAGASSFAGDVAADSELTTMVDEAALLEEPAPDEAAPRTDEAAEKSSEGDDARAALRSLHILGQLHRTFILGETKEGLWIIDQHVAHERVLYERFLAALAAESGDVQRLLVPVTVTLAPSLAGLAEQYGGELARLGFDVEPFGGTTYLVRGVPVELAGSDERRIVETLEELLEACEQEGRWHAHRVAAALACRAAVKAGQPLRDEQMVKLVQQLAEADNPFACPHGRPIVVELSRLDLERRFGRR